MNTVSWKRGKLTCLHFNRDENQSVEGQSLLSESFKSPFYSKTEQL